MYLSLLFCFGLLFIHSNSFHLIYYTTLWRRVRHAAASSGVHGEGAGWQLRMPALRPGLSGLAYACCPLLLACKRLVGPAPSHYQILKYSSMRSAARVFC